MFITGLGVGPSFAIFTIVIQSVVPFDRLGVATGNLTFFRQIGGSIGLAVVGRSSARGWSPSCRNSSWPPASRPTSAKQFAHQASANQQLTNVGTDLGAALAGQNPAELIQTVINALHEAFSLAIASTFWFGVTACLFAFISVVTLMPEVPLRGMTPREGSAKAPEVPAPAI